MLASLYGFAGGSHAKEGSIALQGNAVTQARGCASQNPCSTMRHETPAAPSLGMANHFVSHAKHYQPLHLFQISIAPCAPHHC
jgi:hypothetical protein